MESKPITLGIEKSRSKKIIEGFSYKDLMSVYDELSIIDKALRGLWRITIATEDEKVKSDNYKWLIEMGVGKARQAVDMTSKGEKITAGIFVDDKGI